MQRPTLLPEREPDGTPIIYIEGLHDLPRDLPERYILADPGNCLVPLADLGKKHAKAAQWGPVLQCAEDAMWLLPLARKGDPEGVYRFAYDLLVAGQEAAERLGALDKAEAIGRFLREDPEFRDEVELDEELELGFEADAAVVLEHVRAQPGILQRDLRKLIPAVEDFGGVCYGLAHEGRLRREKRGNTYALFVD